MNTSILTGFVLDFGNGRGMDSPCRHLSQFLKILPDMPLSLGLGDTYPHRQILLSRRDMYIHLASERQAWSRSRSQIVFPCLLAIFKSSLLDGDNEGIVSNGFCGLDDSYADFQADVFFLCILLSAFPQFEVSKTKLTSGPQQGRSRDGLPKISYSVMLSIPRIKGTNSLRVGRKTVTTESRGDGEYFSRLVTADITVGFLEAVPLRGGYNGSRR